MFGHVTTNEPQPLAIVCKTSRKFKLKMDQETKRGQSSESNSRIFNVLMLIFMLAISAFVSIHENRLHTLTDEMTRMKHGYEKDIQKLGHELADIKGIVLPSRFKPMHVSYNSKSSYSGILDFD